MKGEKLFELLIRCKKCRKISRTSYYSKKIFRQKHGLSCGSKYFRTKIIKGG